MCVCVCARVSVTLHGFCVCVCMCVCVCVCHSSNEDIHAREIKGEKKGEASMYEEISTH